MRLANLAAKLSLTAKSQIVRHDVSCDLGEKELLDFYFLMEDLCAPSQKRLPFKKSDPAMQMRQKEARTLTKDGFRIFSLETDKALFTLFRFPNEPWIFR